MLATQPRNFIGNCMGNCVATAAVILALACGSNSAALGTTNTKTGPAASPSKKTAPAEVQALRQAYSLLEVADHDYHGHRVRAMHHIAMACRVLGTSEKGDDDGGEAQNQSDGQLEQARSLLQRAESSFTGKNARAGKQVTLAIQELTPALSVK